MCVGTSCKFGVIARMVGWDLTGARQCMPTLRHDVIVGLLHIITELRVTNK